MSHKSASMLPEAIDRLCDSLTVALCSIDVPDREPLGAPARARLVRAEAAIQRAGRTAWEIHDLCTRDATGDATMPVPRG